MEPESVRRCSLVVLRGLPIAVLHGTPPDPGYQVSVVYRGGQDARLDTRCGPRLAHEWHRVVLVRRPPAARTTPDAPDALEHAGRSLAHAARAARAQAAVLESYCGYGDPTPEGRADLERRAAQARREAAALDTQARALGGGTA